MPEEEPRIQTYIRINGRHVFAGWSDEPIAAALLGLGKANEALTKERDEAQATIARMRTGRP